MRDRMPSLLLAAGVAALLLAALGGLIEPLGLIFRHVSDSYNEGWNADWTRIAWQGGALYPAPDSSVGNNYPPLSFYIVGALGRLVGDDIIAGRLVATLALVAISLNLYCWLRYSGSTRGIAAAAAAFFLATLVSYAPYYVAVDDPQFLAHAFELTALTLLWRNDFGKRTVLATGALMVAAGFIKHLLIPLPVAVTVWIALYRRERLALWITSCAVVLVTGFCAVGLLYGTVFFEDLLSPRVKVASNLPGKEMMRALVALWPLLALSVAASLSFIMPRRDWNSLRRRTVLALLYLGLGWAIAALAIHGEGVDRNAFFDFLIAASVGAGLGLEVIRDVVSAAAAKLRSTYDSRAGRFAVAIVVAAIALVLDRHAAHALPPEIAAVRHAAEHETETLADVALIRGSGKGAVACENMSLCYWADNSSPVDFFNYGQKLAAHALPASSCESVFVNGNVSLVQVLPSPKTGALSVRLPRECIATILEHYRPIRTSINGEFLLRR